MHDLSFLVFNHGFKFQDHIWNDLTILYLNISNIAVILAENAVLCTTLTNLKQFIYQKILFLNIVGISEKVLY